MPKVARLRRPIKLECKATKYTIKGVSIPEEHLPNEYFPPSIERSVGLIVVLGDQCMNHTEGISENLKLCAKKPG